MDDDPGQSAPRFGGWRDELAFLRRVLIVACVFVLLLFFWAVRDALLMAFAAVLASKLHLRDTLGRPTSVPGEEKPGEMVATGDARG